MEKFINFIDILAWVFAILSTLFIIRRMISYIFYTETDKLMHQAMGLRANFSIRKESVIAIICWAWIISNYL